MTQKNYLFTSESVTEGHPDKVCDQVSDAILDEVISGDPAAHVACETMVTTGMIIISGEITSTVPCNYSEVARKTVKDIGYDDSSTGFDYKSCGVMVSVDRQSSDINMGVCREKETMQGAGDQGLMFGYACNETPELMPLSILLSHKICQRMAILRKDKTLSYLRPDGKSQVTIEYRDQKPYRIHTIVVSTQHDDDVTQEKIRQDVIEQVVSPILPDNLLVDDIIYHVNPTGRFVIGGPHGDTGLTGRKIIVDTYGGHASHGGGCFSGKDPSKVDRSASYAARWVAKNVVAAGAAEQCMIQLAYAIGVAEPVSIMINTYGTSKVSEQKITKAVREVFDLTPAGIIKNLNLLRPIYLKTASYGHFGRNEPEFTWEIANKTEELRKKLF